jgi:hypothetical protein
MAMHYDNRLLGLPGGATRGKWGQLVRMGGEWVCGKPTPPRLYPPPVSIKDRSVGPPSKY